MAKYKIDDFSGGITDYIYKSGDKFAEELDNLVINEDVGLVTRFGSTIFDSDYPRVGSNGRIVKHFEFGGDMLLQSGDALYNYQDGIGFSEIQGEGSRSVFYSHDDEDYVDHCILNNRAIFTSVEQKFPPLLVYESVSYEATTAGLPEYPDDPVVTVASGGSSVSYLYAFVYYRSYKVGGDDVEDFGTPRFLTVSSASAEEVSASDSYSIAALNNLGNSLNQFYKIGGAGDVENTDVKIRIYRTTNNGSIFYYLGDTAGLVDNDTTTATDNVPDADLISNEVLYIEGGTLENDSIALLDPKYCTAARGAVWYGNLSGFPNRVIQSKQFQPGAAPGSFTIDFDDDILGMATTRDAPIVFTADKVFRIDGVLDDQGRGNLEKTVITDQIGTINFRTIVQTKRGIYFAGINGWYFTDGFQLRYISQQIDQRFEDLLDRTSQITRMHGTYLPRERKVFWSVMEGADNDKFYVYDEDFNAWTTMSMQAGFVPTSLAVYNGELVHADDEGYLFRYDNSVLDDPLREVGVAVANWNTQAILYDFKHVAVGMGDLRVKKWMNKVNIQIDNQTGQHVDVGSFDERNYTRRDMKPILVEGALAWGASGMIWGSAGITWGGNEMISKTRRFPAGKLRTRFKQLSIKPYRGTLFNSSDYANATPNPATDKVTIDSGTWPTDIVGNYLKIGNLEFEITNRDSNTIITVTDSNNQLTATSTAWTIVGYRKSEQMNLQSITYTYTPLSDRGSYYDSSEADDA